MNNITATILDSGTVRIDTDKISGPAHASAEACLLWIAKELGGDVERKSNKHTHTHLHDHAHDHNHDHQHQ
jgi:hypothetical protein